MVQRLVAWATRDGYRQGWVRLMNFGAVPDPELFRGGRDAVGRQGMRRCQRTPSDDLGCGEGERVERQGHTANLVVYLLDYQIGNDLSDSLSHSAHAKGPQIAYLSPPRRR